MAYEKQNFVNGQVLTAAHMNHIEAGIASLESQIDSDDPSDTSELEARIEAIEDQLYTPIEVTSFTMSPECFEKGSTVTSLTLNWKTNKTPVKQSITCSMPLRVEEMPYANVRYFVDWIAASIDNPVSFSLEVYDEKENRAFATANVTFCNGVYYGVATEPTIYESAFVLGLTKELRANKKSSIAVNAGKGEYIFYCLPVDMGTCSFKVGGFDGGFSLVTTIDVINSSGYTETYYIYRSDNSNLGETTVIVQ